MHAQRIERFETLRKEKLFRSAGVVICWSIFHRQAWAKASLISLRMSKN
jgi:hypothetical protein